MLHLVVRFHVLLSLLVLFLFSPSPLWAGDQDVIVWMEADAPPFFIHEGPLKGQGYEDIISSLIQANLPMYRHESMIANVARHYHNFQHGEQTCTVGFFKTPEREQFAYFSIPSFFTLPTVLVIDREHRDRFGNGQVLSLETMLGEGRLVLGIDKNRSYGQKIDAIINRYKNTKSIRVFSRTEFVTQQFRLLFSDRVDALLALPEEAMYHAERMGVRDRVMTVGIAENHQGYDGWLSYVACSRTPWGREVIARVNEVLRRLRPTKEYRAAYERWLDQSSRKTYRFLYDKVFLAEQPDKL